MVGWSWPIARTHVGLRLVWGTLSRSRSMARGLGMSVLDDSNTWSLIRPGHESSTMSTQLIRRWGLPRESTPGSAHW
jgi:hypothetical protein